MKNARRFYMALLCVALCFSLLPGPALAANAVSVTEGDYRFKVFDDYAELTGYDGSACDLVLPTSVNYNGIAFPVNGVGTDAFDFNGEVTSIIIPEGYTYIGYCAFSCCFELSSISLPNTLTTIEECAFDECCRIKRITIPASVESIGDNAFTSCLNLKSIVFLGNAPTIGNTTFGHVTATAYYPGDDPTWENVVTSSYGGNITWIGVSAPSIITQPQSVTALDGERVTFSVEAEGGGLSYQWFGKNNEADEWSPVPDGSKASLSVAAAEANNGCEYFCRVSNVVGSIDSDVVALTVTPRPDAPVITGQPENVTAQAGTLATFTVQATGDDLEYQWFYKSPASKKWIKVSAPEGKKWTEVPELSGRTEAYGLLATASLNGYGFRCEVSNPGGTVISEEAFLTVSEGISAPAITGQPADITVIENEAVAFSVAAKGGELSYQWYVQKKGAKSWSKVKDATSDTLTVTAKASLNGSKYRCQIKNQAGKVTSAAAKLTVISQPKITTQPKSATVKAGKTATFKVKASGGELSYQWYCLSPDGVVTPVDGAMSATLKVKAEKAKHGFQYYCVVSNIAGTITSRTVTLKIKK